MDDHLGKPSARGQPTKSTQRFILLGRQMSSELQLDVRHFSQWWRHLVNAYEVKTQAWWKVMAAYHRQMT